MVPKEHLHIEFLYFLDILDIYGLKWAIDQSLIKKWGAWLQILSKILAEYFTPTYVDLGGVLIKKSSKLFWICKWGQIGGKSSSVTCPSFVHLTSFILLLVMQRTKFYFFIGNLKVKQAISCYCSSLDLYDVKLGPFSSGQCITN